MNLWEFAVARAERQAMTRKEANLALAQALESEKHLPPRDGKPTFPIVIRIPEEHNGRRRK